MTISFILSLAKSVALVKTAALIVAGRLAGPLRGRMGARFKMSEESRKKWRAFRRNRRGYYSLIVLVTLLVLSLFAEALAKHGLESRMGSEYEAELADLPEKSAA